MIPMIKTLNPKVQELLTLLKDPEVYDVFKGLVVKVLTDPEYLVLKRISNIESHLGANEFYCIGEDSFHEDKEVMHSIPEQISLLSSLINDVSVPVLRETVYSGNETEIRATFLKNKLPEVAMMNGKRFMTSKDVRTFLVRDIPKEHKVNDSKNTARKAAYDVMIKASEMFPNALKLTKNKRNVNVIELIEKR